MQLDKQGGVAVFTVDNPDVKNGLTPEMGMQLSALCDEVDADPAIGAAVVRGAGGMFCSGADRRRWTPGADQAEDTNYKELGAVYTAFKRVGGLQVPTIAAVRGAAVGAGLNLALATDLRVVAENARLLAGFLRIGLHPGGGYFTISSRTAGREATAAMGLFSEEVDGNRAVEIGLAWKAVPGRPGRGPGAGAGRPRREGPRARPRGGALVPRRGQTARGSPWDAALHFERATQMWSMRRRETA